MIQSGIKDRQTRMLYMFVVGILGVFMAFSTVFFKFRSKRCVPENFLENYMNN
jgi:hypothetical protein